MASRTAECESVMVHEESVRRVALALPSDEALSRTAALFRVFGDATRIKILDALSLSELCVCDIASLLTVSCSAVSHQLRILRQANMVRTRRAGKSIYYRLSDSHVESLVNQGLVRSSEGMKDERRTRAHVPARAADAPSPGGGPGRPVRRPPD